MYVIIIISIVVLLIAAIFINAMQQHRQKQEAERRTELAKQRVIVDETEKVITSSINMPVSSRIMGILHNRMLNALRVMNELASTTDLKQRIVSSEQAMTAALSDTSGSMNDFTLPDNDKMIIQYIQSVKKLRIMLRSEHSKGQIDSKVFADEDKQLERLQVKVNVETLIKRGRAALQTNMLGSARQYFEKAKAALESQNPQDDYSTSKLAALNEWLNEIQNNLKSVNEKDRVRKQEEERDELDELFAPKKKW
ncbi:hypothetical protein JC525_05710 [Alteromonas sp. IB21]|uniref:hypothetical protein n=1 Tax=Alteromonas sp. IB21 TaxID=2779369 RepID=UPI0018E87A02|nr:hypothetical protein [Alteromonas sp. IB21]MBJ2128427.1 hypothetical protein [Alteromonas sp. IB21]|tara:strand:- start:1102 stop:1860 length:759 start_codon:yes stop_codon:yes gene_type:complete